MDQTVFIILSGLVLLGKFADFALQKAAELSAAEQQAQSSSSLLILPDSMVGPEAQRAAHRSWLSAAVAIASEYMIEVFDNKTLSPKRLGRVFLISAFFVQGTFIFSSLLVDEIWQAWTQFGILAGITLFVGLLILFNFIFDLAAVAASIWYSKRIVDELNGDCTTIEFILKSIFVVFLVYFLMFLVMSCTFFSIIVAQGFAANYDLSHGETLMTVFWNIFVSDTIHRFLDPLNEGYHLGINGVNLLVFCITPLLLPSLLAICCLVGVVLDGIDSATDHMVARYARRMAADSKPVFLKLASVLALLGAGTATLTGLG
ncbi:MAG: hypothetical protein AAF293_17670 [Pseudomonadota bacterium]